MQYRQRVSKVEGELVVLHLAIEQDDPVVRAPTRRARHQLEVARGRVVGTPAERQLERLSAIVPLCSFHHYINCVIYNTRLYNMHVDYVLRRV